MTNSKTLTAKQENLEVMQVLINSMYEAGITYVQIANLAECAKNSVTNWKKSISSPALHYFQKIEKNIMPLLAANKEDLDVKIMANIRSKGKDVKTVQFILERLSPEAGICRFLQYYVFNYQNDRKLDLLEELITNPEYLEYIRKVLLKKLQIKGKGYKFFDADFWAFSRGSDIDTEPILKDGNWLMLRFADSESSYGYRTLLHIKYSYSKEELLQLSLFMRDNPDKVNMMVLITADRVSQKELHYCIQDNIYVEKLKVKDVAEESASENFIYEEGPDAEKLLPINRFCDTIWNRISKYFSVIYKNIIFSHLDEKLKEGKRAERGILWEDHFANRHEINFECERIKEILSRENSSGNSPCSRDKVAVSIGFVSFPVLLMLREHFQKIICLDNAMDCINEYKRKFGGRGDFSIFTSSIADYITNRCSLYHSVDLVVIGTGYASFLRYPSVYYQYINTWLKNDGIVYISYYNSEFIYDYIDWITLNQNMDFLPVADTKTAKVNINKAGKYYIYCETNNYKDAKSFVGRYFELQNIYSYPVASVLFEQGKHFLQNILKELDKEYARKGVSLDNMTFSNCRGCFLDIVAQKKTKPLVCSSGMEQHLIHHAYARTCDNRYEQLKKEGLREDGHNYVKVLICQDRNTSGSMTLPGIKCYYAIALPYNKQIEETTDNEVVVFSKKLKLLNIQQLNELGFEIGNITPFFTFKNENVKWIKICDHSLLSSSYPYIFTGSGRCDASIKMSKREFQGYLEQYSYDYSQVLGG